MEIIFSPLQIPFSQPPFHFVFIKSGFRVSIHSGDIHTCLQSEIFQIQNKLRKAPRWTDTSTLKHLKENLTFRMPWWNEGKKSQNENFNHGRCLPARKSEFPIARVGRRTLCEAHLKELGERLAGASCCLQTQTAHSRGNRKGRFCVLPLELQSVTEAEGTTEQSNEEQPNKSDKVVCTTRRARKSSPMSVSRQDAAALEIRVMDQHQLPLSGVN